MVLDYFGFMFRPINNENGANRAIKYSAFPMLVFLGFVIFLKIDSMLSEYEHDLIRTTWWDVFVTIFICSLIAIPSLFVLFGRSKWLIPSHIFTIIVMVVIAFPFLIGAIMALTNVMDEHWNGSKIGFFGFLLLIVFGYGVSIFLLIRGLGGLSWLVKNKFE